MSLPRREEAIVVQLSPSQDAVVRGPGRATLIKGSQTWAMNEREARALVLGWLLYEEARRPGTIDALRAILPGGSGETAPTAD